MAAAVIAAGAPATVLVRASAAGASAATRASGTTLPATSDHRRWVRRRAAGAARWSMGLPGRGTCRRGTWGIGRCGAHLESVASAARPKPQAGPSDRKLDGSGAQSALGRESLLSDGPLDAQPRLG